MVFFYGICDFVTSQGNLRVEVESISLAVGQNVASTSGLDTSLETTPMNKRRKFNAVAPPRPSTTSSTASRCVYFTIQTYFALTIITVSLIVNHRFKSLQVLQGRAFCTLPIVILSLTLLKNADPFPVPRPCRRWLSEPLKARCHPPSIMTLLPPPSWSSQQRALQRLVASVKQRIHSFFPKCSTRCICIVIVDNVLWSKNHNLDSLCSLGMKLKGETSLANLIPFPYN